jgi:PAS domain S-box-containing protein
MSIIKNKIIYYTAIFFILILLSCEKSETVVQVSLDPAEKQWLSNHRDELYFAPDPYYAPFEFYDERDGVTRGLAHDYIRLIAGKLGIQFKLIPAATFNEILSFAKQKKVSIVNAATETPERSEYLLFTKPIIEIKNVILTRKGESINLTLEKLSGKKVSLVQGYAITEYIINKYPGIKYNLVSADINAILNVSYRISDAAVIDLATASYLTEKEGISNIHVAGDAGYPVKLAIGSRKDWPELNSILNKGLDSITPQERDEIYRRWIGLKNISFAQSREFRIAVLLIISLFAGLGVILLWNKQLKKQILLRTTNLKRALGELSKSEEQHRSILQTAMDGFLRLDTRGVILEVNESYCRMSGYNREELTGMTIADMEAAESPADIAARTGRLMVRGEDRFETLHRRKNGSIYNVEISVQYRSEEDGLMVAFLRDITENKNATEQLRKSEEKYRSIFENVQNVYYEVAVDGTILESSPFIETLSNGQYTREEVIGRSIYDFYTNMDDRGVILSSLLKDGRVTDFESNFRNKDGSVIPCVLSAKLCYDSRGHPEKIIGSMRDIIAQKKAREEISSLLRAKELLLEEVHHRIKNNMNTIKGLLTLQISAEEDSSAAASLRDAESRVQSMIMLYDRLYCTDNFRELSVKDYLQSLTEEIIGSFPNNGIITIVIDIDDFVLNIQMLTPLGIIVNEILTNAMKYAFVGRESGIITLSASLKENRVNVTIRDNGSGIPESVSFDKSKGFGLDLVSMLTDQMGGSIRIERGNGAGFILEFKV